MAYLGAVPSNDDMNASELRYDLWGVELSPFALKLSAMLKWAGVRHRWLPSEGKRLENVSASLTLATAKRKGRVLRHGGRNALDELPQVPFLIGPNRDVHYDSSALADWIDATHPCELGPLVPEDPVVGFVARLIDEAFDEFGLYMVHHNRWVLAAADNGAGDRLAKAFSNFLPPGGPAMLARSFPKRQVRRLPYLFSVAPGEKGDARTSDAWTDLPADLRPPARTGFPATHAMLDRAWQMHLAAMEVLLEKQAYLLGARFTLADASVYGELSMNLTDRSAALELEARAPRTFAWLSEIRDGGHVGGGGAVVLNDALRPLLDAISQTFVPLMCQNERAYTEACSRGETLFNEAAFDRGRALYDGELLGVPFRSVAKTFQVRAWRDLRGRWQNLSDEERTRLATWLPDLEKAMAPVP